MGRAHVIVRSDLREPLKQEQQLANQVMFLRETAFCDATHIALVWSPYLPHGYNGQQALVVEGS